VLQCHIAVLCIVSSLEWFVCDVRMLNSLSGVLLPNKSMHIVQIIGTVEQLTVKSLVQGRVGSTVVVVGFVYHWPKHNTGSVSTTGRQGQPAHVHMLTQPAAAITLKSW
jgi:hypothetical protein